MALVRDELEGFAEFIRERRKFLGLTQTELARRLGISPSMVTRLESGEREPSARLLLRLLEVLRADLRDIR
jgi:transcriptional regulator with XRE-family HTH domain